MKYLINKSKLMKRAWYLHRNNYLSLSDAMKQVWKEMKSFIAEKIKEDEYELWLQTNNPLLPYTPNPNSMYEFYQSNCYKGD